jgi:cytochrome b561
MGYRPRIQSGWQRILARLKHGALIALFILVPFAGAFHPKLRKKENPEEKEIGAEK